MLGNGWEWTASSARSEFSLNPKSALPVLRGGSFVDSLDGKFNRQVNLTVRMITAPDAGSNSLVFRCAFDLDRDAQQAIMALEANRWNENPDENGEKAKLGAKSANQNHDEYEFEMIEELEVFDEDSGEGDFGFKDDWVDFGTLPNVKDNRILTDDEL